MSYCFRTLIPVLLCLQISNYSCFPDQGRWRFSKENSDEYYIGVAKTLYEGSKVSVAVNCETSNENTKDPSLKIGWLLRQTPCYDEYVGLSTMEKSLPFYYNCLVWPPGTKIRYMKPLEEVAKCSHIHIVSHNESIILHTEKDKIDPSFRKNCELGEENPETSNSNPKSSSNPEGRTLAKKEQLESIPTPLNLIDKRPKRDANMEAHLGAHLDDVKDISTDNKNVKRSSKESSQADENKSANRKPDSESKGKTDSDALSDNKVTTDKYSKHILSNEGSDLKTNDYLVQVDQDGVYLFIVFLKAENKGDVFSVTVDIKMKGDYGYLSATDWPLLPFYGVMCGIYVIYAVIWLVISALQWRDLLRVQFWIGGVIFLGLMEKAVFYAEYQSINSTGQSVQGAVLFAEILSCMKRTLARMLVIIVSLGFGIVKPRLGPMLHRVVGMGALYFILATIEGCLRAVRPKNDPSNQTLMAGIPLAVMDTAICWWIFSSLVQTTRTLRLRRNLVKLSLYRHFTNTLIFAVLASIAYMIWSIHSHKLTSCITDWKELWVDEAYWPLLFSLVLLVIMILWRPTKNNQRYSFTPLLDAVDDEEEDDQTVANDAFAGMKMRSSKNQSNDSPKENDKTNSKVEEDIKWIDENIPSSLSDIALPNLLDSDEEIMTAKFERSKME